MENIRSTLYKLIDEWVKSSVQNKGIDPTTNMKIHAFEYVNAVPLGSMINNLIDVLKQSKENKDGTIEIFQPTFLENKNVGRKK